MGYKRLKLPIKETIPVVLKDLQLVSVCASSLRLLYRLTDKRIINVKYNESINISIKGPFYWPDSLGGIQTGAKQHKGAITDFPTH